jgi:aminopeptidase-like protein
MESDNCLLACSVSDSSGDELGEGMHNLVTELWPINRSLTGPGVRKTLDVLKRELPEISIQSIASGTECFDWVVPEEWNITEAFIENEAGERLIDFEHNNLHVVGYSIPVDEWFDLEELQNHLYSLPEQPNAIPYITSYYVRRWGFCLTDRQRQSLQTGRYRAVIRSELKPGVLNYAEAIIPGETEQEILLSTYICHPSMANNELSGPVVMVALGAWLKTLPKRRYTYRLLFIPETIGSIAYLSKNFPAMKQRTVAGFVITCIGDDRMYSFLPSREGKSLADMVAEHVLKHFAPEYKKYSFLDRGSDERQYCSPGIDLPVASIMRTKYGEYPEYHTSLDDLSLVTPKGLFGGFSAYKLTLQCLHGNCYPKVTVLCEPQLGKRGLYPTLSTKTSGQEVLAMMNLIAYADGTMSLLEIAEKIGEPMWELLPIVERLSQAGLLVTSDGHISPQKVPVANSHIA